MTNNDDDDDDDVVSPCVDLREQPFVRTRSMPFKNTHFSIDFISVLSTFLSLWHSFSLFKSFEVILSCAFIRNWTWFWSPLPFAHAHTHTRCLFNLFYIPLLLHLFSLFNMAYILYCIVLTWTESFRVNGTWSSFCRRIYYLRSIQTQLNFPISHTHTYTDTGALVLGDELFPMELLHWTQCTYTAY